LLLFFIPSLHYDSFILGGVICKSLSWFIDHSPIMNFSDD
jgi:hypothetical protein